MKAGLLRTSGFVFLLGCVSASAQTQAASPGPAPTTATPDPLALPGDFMDISQSAQLHVPLGPGPGSAQKTPFPHRPPDMTPTPGFALALEAADAAMAACKADGYGVDIAVTDAAGKLKVALASDGTASNGVFMALRKDVTVTQFGMSTLALRQKIAKDPSLIGEVKPSMSLLPGGLPIIKGTQLVGAISASGANAYEEEKCARAGLQQIQSRLQ